MSAGQGIIVELIPHGRYVKATAVDVGSGREVSVVGAATASDSELRALATKRLISVMEKEAKEKKASQSKVYRGKWV